MPFPAWNRTYLFKSNFIASLLWSKCPQGTGRPLKGPDPSVLVPRFPSWLPAKWGFRVNCSSRGEDTQEWCLPSPLWQTCQKVGVWLFPALCWHGAQGPALCLMGEAEPGRPELPASYLPRVPGFSFTPRGLHIPGTVEKTVLLCPFAGLWLPSQRLRTENTLMCPVGPVSLSMEQGCVASLGNPFLGLLHCVHRKNFS